MGLSAPDIKIIPQAFAYFNMQFKARDLYGFTALQQEHMSPFLTCFPRLLSAKPFGWGHTHRAHIKRRRLIMPLVALVQKKQSAPATAYKYWCLGFASSSPLLLAFRLRTNKVRSSFHHNCERSEQYHLPKANITDVGNITAKQYNFAKISYFCKIKGTRLSAFFVSRLRNL